MVGKMNRFAAILLFGGCVAMHVIASHKMAEQSGCLTLMCYLVGGWLLMLLVMGAGCSSPYGR